MWFLHRLRDPELMPKPEPKPEPEPESEPASEPEENHTDPDFPGPYSLFLAAPTKPKENNTFKGESSYVWNAAPPINAGRI